MGETEMKRETGIRYTADKKWPAVDSLWQMRGEYRLDAPFRVSYVITRRESSGLGGPNRWAWHVEVDGDTVDRSMDHKGGDDGFATPDEAFENMAVEALAALEYREANPVGEVAPRTSLTSLGGASVDEALAQERANDPLLGDE